MVRGFGHNGSCARSGTDADNSHMQDDRGLRVLVIDDDPDVLLLCRLNLGRGSSEVLEACSGADGLALVDLGEPDVVVLVVMMPVIDGLEVLRRLRSQERTSHTRVVLLSARVSTEDQVAGFEAGADEYLTKPFEPSQLAETIERVARASSEQCLARREARMRELAAR
jgi:DNA-binding response OmpR family regulator